MRIYAELAALFTVLLAVTLLPALPLRSAWAQAGVYTVTDIRVDRTAETAAEARELAIADGHVQALQRLYEKILPADQISSAPRLSAKQIPPYVLAFSVDSEQSSAVRYIATLTFKFLADDVRGLLGQQGVTAARSESPPVLVLPLFSQDGQNRLWQDPNPWRDAWANRGSGSGFVPLMVPLGDLGDVSAVDVEGALTADPVKLAAVAQRYNAAAVLVSQSILSGDPEAGTAQLQTITRADGSYLTQPLTSSFAQEPGESLASLFARAASDLDSAVQGGWDQDNMVQVGGARNAISVLVAARSFNEWISIKKRLSQLAMVQSTQVRKLSPGASEIDIGFSGDTDQLVRALGQRSLLLIPSEDGQWLLQSR